MRKRIVAFTDATIGCGRAKEKYMAADIQRGGDLKLRGLQTFTSVQNAPSCRRQPLIEFDEHSSD